MYSKTYKLVPSKVKNFSNSATELETYVYSRFHWIKTKIRLLSYWSLLWESWKRVKPIKRAHKLYLNIKKKLSKQFEMMRKKIGKETVNINKHKFRPCRNRENFTTT